jgi:hypothetical protein
MIVVAQVTMDDESGEGGGGAGESCQWAWAWAQAIKCILVTLAAHTNAHVCGTYTSLETLDTWAVLLQTNMYILVSLHDARRIPARRARSTHSQAPPRVAKPPAGHTRPGPRRRAGASRAHARSRFRLRPSPAGRPARAASPACGARSRASARTAQRRTAMCMSVCVPGRQKGTNGELPIREARAGLECRR